MEVNVGDIFIANVYFYRIYEVHSNYVMVERLGSKAIASDFDLKRFRRVATDINNYSKFGNRWVWGHDWNTYPLIMAIAPTEDTFEQFKMMIDNKEEMLKSGQQRLYLTTKYTGPIIYKTTMLNDYKFLPTETVEQIEQIMRDCRKKADAMPV